MTRKDFKLIAQAINEVAWWQQGTAQITSINLVAEQFAETLATTNPNFDKSKFLEACGV